jgi:KUP system potassium uptake protein
VWRQTAIRYWDKVSLLPASGSLIARKFSLFRRLGDSVAKRLNFLPKAEAPWLSLLMIATVGLTLGFGKSDNLAAAYGIAVSATMLITSALRDIWRWSVLASAAVAGGFFIVDAAFLIANLTKIAEGGYVPLMLAACVYLIMVVWHTGAAAVAERLREAVMPIGKFMKMIEEAQIPRVPGTAVFLTRTQRDVPPVMVWHLKHNRALHKYLFVLTVNTQSVPWTSVPWTREAERLTFDEIAPNFWRASARHGFMERPNIPVLLEKVHRRGCNINLHDITYYVGHETVISRSDEKGQPRWLETLFAFMQRNSSHLTDYFRLPSDTVVEIGRQIAI